MDYDCNRDEHLNRLLRRLVVQIGHVAILLYVGWGSQNLSGVNDRYRKARFPLPKLTARVNGPS